MGKLAGKTAVVTGGYSGIGRATVLRFVAEGANVFSFDRCEAALGEAAEAIVRDVTVVHGDVRVPSDLDRLAAVVARQAGRVDIVFANAGVLGQ